MSVYQGVVPHTELPIKIDEILTAEGYQQVSSNIESDGYVYKSNGIDGKKEMYVYVKTLNSNSLIMGINEKYTPSNPGLSGTFSSVGYEKDFVVWNSSFSSQNVVNYILNVNKDRIIFYAEGELFNTSRRDTITYIGLPARYDDKDITSDFAGIIGTSNSYGSSAWYALRNIANVPISNYSTTMYSMNKSLTWGEEIFASPIFLYRSDEGMRGELEGLKIVSSDSANRLVHRDVIIKDGKKYMFIVLTSQSSPYGLPSSYNYLMEI